MNKNKGENNTTRTQDQQNTEKPITQTLNQERSVKKPDSNKSAKNTNYQQCITKWLRKPLVRISGTILSNVLIILITATYAYFACRQWKAIDKQTGFVSNQAETMKKQADIMKQQAGIMSKQTEILSKQMIISERAWVSVPQFILDREPSENGSITILCVLVNSGKTPAINVRDKYRISIRSDESVEPDWPNVKDSAPLVLPPGVSPTSFWFPAKQEAIPKLAAEAYKTGINKIWIRTFVSYSDVFGQRHWVKTCSFHTIGMPLDNFTGCNDGNAVDTE